MQGKRQMGREGGRDDLETIRVCGRGGMNTGGMYRLCDSLMAKVVSWYSEVPRCKEGRPKGMGAGIPIISIMVKPYTCCTAVGSCCIVCCCF